MTAIAGCGCVRVLPSDPHVAGCREREETLPCGMLPTDEPPRERIARLERELRDARAASTKYVDLTDAHLDTLSAKLEAVTQERDAALDSLSHMHRKEAESYGGLVDCVAELAAVTQAAEKLAASLRTMLARPGISLLKPELAANAWVTDARAALSSWDAMKGRGTR